MTGIPILILLIILISMLDNSTSKYVLVETDQEKETPGKQILYFRESECQ